MTPATALRRLGRVLGFGLRPGGERSVPILPRRRAARRAVAWFVLATAALHLAVLLALDHTRPHLRDPEYARRVSRLRARVAEHPGRPLVVCVGSSRTAMGVRPGAWEADRPNVPGKPDPLLFNVGLLGSGSVMELMVVRRLAADGVRPALVLIEYWPPFLYSEKGWHEPNRVAADRLADTDREVVRGYFKNPAGIEERMRKARANPVYGNRERLLVQLMPNWLPPGRRVDGGWLGLDPWGWLPGIDLPTGPSERRTESLAICRDIYKPLFADYRVSPDSDRALREAVAAARANGSAVGFVWLPESSEFRGWYPPAAERAAKEHLAGVSRELSVPVIDARTWADDGALVDGFHLSRIGAAEFTRKLGPAIVGTFPELQVRP